MTVIDLGELRDDPVPEPARRRSRPTGRPYRLLGVLAVALLTLAGGVPLVGWPAVAVPARPGANVFLSGDRLYLIEPPDLDRNEGRRLTAYRIPAAGPPTLLWRSRLPEGGGAEIGLLDRGGTVVLTGLSGVGDDAHRTFTVDARTGRPGWQQPGFAFEAVDGVLLQTSDADGAVTVRRVELPSGRALWSVSSPPGGLDFGFGPAGIDRIVLSSSAGEVEVRDARTGTRLVARDLSAGGPRSWEGIQLVDGLLLTFADKGATVTGYDLDRLERRWTARLDRGGYLSPCGTLLCTSSDTGGMSVLDPATGAVRWSDPHWHQVMREHAGRFLVTAADAGRASRYAVVESATGRPLAELGGDWELVNRAGPDDPLIGLRRGADGRLRVAELDLTAARAQVFAAPPGLIGDCQVGAGVLVCRRIDGGFVLWRLR
ncbi:PQQ-like beta-propeller repeat protein [Micromonospora sp. R77]|uniref:outer membrane protein assembly factor BamB family protein n=1 Tax=Micromonospora sp. R77 TaxID=2925836 RepID=UPI001F603293|nr:PQQ-binding-like beta-propeller repeat protein [Micromonospora sp. R77]MCI4064955.1 PQQ-like beta-propeller repeat protein [Micromonospora sp. R77]